MATNTKQSPGFAGQRSDYSEKTIVLSWVVSLFFHLLLFAILFLVPWLADYVRLDEVPVTATQIVGAVDQPLAAASAASKLVSSAPVQADALSRVEPEPFDLLAETPKTHEAEISIIGIGAGAGSNLARFGLQTVAQTPGPEFFGLGGEARGARRIAYVVDQSGSMIESFGGVRRELKRSISALRRSQKFHVIFFNNNALEIPPKKMVSAIKARKRRAFEFFNSVAPERGTDPGQALRIAFRNDPDVIYFLTDGAFGELDDQVF